MKQIICISCPRGCHLTVDEQNDFAVTGNSCARGVSYGKAEAQNPTRMLTSTVKLTNAALRRCPVRTLAPIPKSKLMEVMSALNQITLSAPVEAGDVILKDAADTGVSIIATRSIVK